MCRLGLGTLQWGDPGCGYGTKYDKAQLQQMFNTAVQGGINFWDTAEVYGYQGNADGTSSEHLVGQFVREAEPQDPPLVVGTKFFTIPWTNMLLGGSFRIGKSSMVEAMRSSTKRLGVDTIELYQVHFPFPTFPPGVLADALEQGRDEGLIHHVGCCNHDPSQMEALAKELDKRGMKLVTNQVHYSLLDRTPEKSGLLQACQDMGVQLVAHTPLERGLLTARTLESGHPKATQDIITLLKLLGFVGTLLGGKTAGQVALRYLMQKGAIPIPGAKTMAQVDEHLGALGWGLDDNEMAIIDEKLASLGK